MFMMTMPISFRVGDTAQVKINGEAATLTWQTSRTLVINGTDTRAIIHKERVTAGRQLEGTPR
jgi:hypothetical protein